ncbi:hypothetical protein H0H92_009248, partial [Tricholoma furcatifolium]
IVALNQEQFVENGDGYPGPYCFKTITMTYNGISAQATIMDECPGCPYGGLDLSRGLFSHFAAESIGVLYGEWYFNDGSDSTPTTTKTTYKTTSTWKPSTTWTPTSTSTSTSTSKHTSSSSTHSSSSSSSSTSTKTTSTSSQSTSSTVPTPDPTSNLLLLNEAFINLGNLIAAGAAANA